MQGHIRHQSHLVENLDVRDRWADVSRDAVDENMVEQASLRIIWLERAHALQVIHSRILTE